MKKRVWQFALRMVEQPIKYNFIGPFIKKTSSLLENEKNEVFSFKFAEK